MRFPALLLLLTVSLAACTNVPLNQAPVERGGFTPATHPGAGAAPTGGALAAHAGEPGYYTVKPGDTLLRIALQAGQSWHALVRWNALANPNVIEVGQVLRVAPPDAANPPPLPPGSGAQAFAVAPAPGLAAVPATPAAASSPNAAASSPVRNVAKVRSPAVVAPPPARAPVIKSGPVVADADLRWGWPAQGKILQGFNGTSSKGLDIAGRASDPVLCAAAGRVVYAGNELRGFGNLVIVKHNADYISVYAHNEKLLVKDGDDVKKGQKIALMGSTDAPHVELHFEVRLRGKPIDPMQVLPPR